MSDKKHRMQFDASDAGLAQLDEIVARTDAASRAEVIRRAISLYNRLSRRATEGYEYVERAPDGTERILVFFF